MEVFSCLVYYYLFYIDWEQLLKNYTNLSQFCFLGTTPVLAANVWANENPKVDPRSWKSNWEPHDCEADALPPHDRNLDSNIELLE